MKVQFTSSEIYPLAKTEGTDARVAFPVALRDPSVAIRLAYPQLMVNLRDASLESVFTDDLSGGVRLLARKLPDADVLVLVTGHFEPPVTPFVEPLQYYQLLIWRSSIIITWIAITNTLSDDTLDAALRRQVSRKILPF